jgi:cytochrome c553
VRHYLQLWILASLLLAYGVAWAQNSHQTPPYWAYVINPNSEPAAGPTDHAPRHVPGSGAAFTLAQIADLFNPPDWHPEGHAAMPEIVAHGRKPDVFACAYCHLPNGQGRPENSSLAGLPAGYIVEQLEDFKSGARKSSEPRHLPIAMMIASETKATGQEIQSAANYFSGLTRKPWVRVVETGTVPKTRVAGWMLAPSTPAATERIGERIIEVPENLERTEARDDASGFIAYVPEGSLARGRALVNTGSNGKAIPCAKCHGPGLRGSGNMPPIAGRSPSYLVRQLFDIQSGARAGTLSREMRAPIRNLTLDDMIAISAYVASLRP